MPTLGKLNKKRTAIQKRKNDMMETDQHEQKRRNKQS